MIGSITLQLLNDTSTGCGMKGPGPYYLGPRSNLPEGYVYDPRPRPVYSTHSYRSKTIPY